MQRLTLILLVLICGGCEVKEIDGKIVHPTYGTYPKEIPYQEGMTLMPGQSAVIKLDDGKK